MTIQKKTDWSIRRALPEEDARLAAFLSEHVWRNGASGHDVYRWKYLRNVQGELTALLGTNQSGDIVATSMFMPWKLSIGGQPVKACQWADLFVAAEYRGQSLADLTLRQGMAESRGLGARVWFAFPNANSVPLHRKNHGTHLGHIVRLTKPLNVEYLLKRRVGNPAIAKALASLINPGIRLFYQERFPDGCFVERVVSFGPEFDDLWQRHVAQNPDMVMTWKDAAYLNWKYLEDIPGHRRVFATRREGRLEGFIVLEMSEDAGYILDVLALSDSVLNELIVFALDTFRKEGKQSAIFTVLENNVQLPVFQRLGFVPRPGPSHFFVYLDDSISADLKDARRWFITLGDCDVH
jgi:predicted N-acetyltransferase YhbS